jgi:hypothetical protein
MEKIQKPEKRKDRLERATLEGFSPITQSNADQVPGAAMDQLVSIGVLEGYSQEDDTDKTEVMMRSDTDGITLVLGTVIDKQSGEFTGVLVQTEEDEAIGRTSFARTGLGSGFAAYVTSTNTWKHKREGLGEERMRLINAYTKEKFGLPLSSISRSDSAQGLWDKLLAEGLADRKRVGDSVVYTML